MTTALARMILVGLVTLALYGATILALDALPGVALLQPAPLGWVGVFAIASVFAAWNLLDALGDARANYRKYGSGRLLAGAFWHVRSHALQGAGCTAWAGAGALAIVGWGTLELRTACYIIGALCFAANQIWNRLDRERIVRMPGPTSEARRMEILAAQIAATGRAMGHDLNDALQTPVAVLELLRARPGMAPDEVAQIDQAIKACLDLAAHTTSLHERIRDLDPSYRRRTT